MPTRSEAQFDNLVLIAVIYLIVMIIEDQYDENNENTWPEIINNLFHYMLLGFFSTNYWILILIVTVLYDVTQIRTITDAGNVLMAVAVSSKYIGLLIGIILYRIYPYKIDLLAYLSVSS